MFSDRVSEAKKDLLLRVAPLVSGDFKERRKKVYRSFVSAALLEINEMANFSVKDIVSQIYILTGLRLDEENVVTVLLELEKEGYVESVGGFNYILKSKPKMLSIDEAILEPLWKDFSNFLYRSGVDPIDLDSYLDMSVKTVFKEAMTQIFLRLVDLGDLNNLSQIEEISPIERKEIERLAMCREIKNPKRFVDLFFDYLSSKSKILSESIYKIYEGIVNINILTREKELTELYNLYIKHNLKSFFKFILIDTCIIVALLCESDRVHDLAVYTIKRLRESGIPIYYTPRTKEEMNNFIKISDKEMRCKKTIPLPVIRSQLVNDALTRKIPWDIYIAQIKLWEDTLKREYGITLLPNTYPIDDKDEVIYEFAKRTIPVLDKLRAEQSKQGFYRERTNETIEHDAYCMSFISKLRQDLKTGPWFLTFDNLLLAVDALYQKEHDSEFGLILHPRVVLNYFMSFSGANFDENEKEKIALAVLKYTINFGDRVDLEKFARMLVNKIDIGGLADTDEYIKLIVELFVKSPLRYELEQALEENRGDKAEEIAEKILTDPNIAEAIRSNVENRKRIKELIERIKQLQREKEKLEAVKKAYEEIVTRPQEVSVTLSAQICIDVKLLNQIVGIIKILEGNGFFDKGIIERPDLSDKSKIKSWLEKLKSILETSKDVSETLKSLLPLVTSMLSMLR